MPLGGAQKRVKRGERGEEGGGAKAPRSLALEGPRGQGAPGRAPNAERAVVGPGHPRKHAEFLRAARSSSAARPAPPPGGSGVPSWGPGVEESAACGPCPPTRAQPRRLGSQRSGRAPPGRSRRARSWAPGTLTPTRGILCGGPLCSGGSPNPAALSPAASLRPQPPAQRDIKAPAARLHGFGDTSPAGAGARPRGGTVRRGRAGGGRRSPYRPGPRPGQRRRPLPPPPPLPLPSPRPLRAPRR